MIERFQIIRRVVIAASSCRQPIAYLLAILAAALLFVPALEIRAAHAFALAADAAPTIATISPAPGTVSKLTSIAVTFSRPVTGIEADDFLVNGLPPDSISNAGNTFTFVFAQPLYGRVFITWADGHGIADLSAPTNPFDATAPGATWQYDLVDNIAPTVLNLHPASGATVRSLSQVEVTFSEDVAGVDASDLLINGRPATEVTKLRGGPFIFRFAPQPAGTVQVSWVSAHGITDTAAAPNRLDGASWSYVVNTNSLGSDLVIGEILASNVSTTGARDEDNELQSWIEIYNRGDNPVNLEHWSLSDDPDVPGLWVFPARILGPKEYLVVFASGKDRALTDSLARLHTNFKLADAGEFLGLYTADSPRVLVSGFNPFPEQRNNVSYGTDLNGQLRYFAPPTPGRPNGVSTILGVCAPVQVNVKRGHFNSPFDLMLSCATPDVVFRYTTDGSEPTGESSVFPPVLRLAKTTLFRAAAFKENFLPSKASTHSYFFNLPANVRSLPIFSIVTSTNHLYGKTGILGINGGNYRNGPWAPNAGATNDYHNPSKHGLAWERPTSVEWIRPEDNSGFQVDCGIRVQGSDYQRPRLTRTSKFSFRLYFRGDYGAGRLDYPLFPLTNVRRFDQLVLRAGFNEQGNPFIRDEIHRRLSSDMGQVASHGNLAVVFINGVYYTSSPWYNPCERVHEEFLQQHLGGGNEWDVVGPTFAQSAGAAGVIDGDRSNFATLVNYVRTQPVTEPAVYLEVSRRLELTNFVDYCLLNTYAAMGDWPANNWRAGKDRGSNGIWRFIVWDAEWGMGIYDRTTNINSFTESGGGPNDSGLGTVNSSEIARIYDRLRANYEFRLLWADRVHKHFFNGGALTGANITNRFEELRREMIVLIPNMEREILQWARDRQTIFFRQMQPYGLLASSNAPVFGQFGGRVPAGYGLVMTNLAGTIYYTMDGSDPRIPFTSVPSSQANSYAGPVSLHASTTIKARTLQGTNWSALAEATFRVESLGNPLRVTEVMFNPAGGSRYEFLELQNTGATALDLSGVHFDGINFIFLEGSTLAGGARCVLASNTDTNGWKARYPGVPVAGWFGGNLNNDGERITIFDAKGNIITSVDYKNSGGWPADADGAGKSLEVIAVDGDPDNPANWKSSTPANGTPGSANSISANPSVFLNEVMADNVSAVSNAGAYPDWIELYNSSTAPANLSGWSLSDGSDPRRFVFPLGTTIPAAGYLMVWGDAATNASSGLHTGFAFDRDGDKVFLYDAATNRVDAVTFGSQVPNNSIGRVKGEWLLTTPTPNAPNIAVALGSTTNLSLNEWLANPAPGEGDWIELFNRSQTEPVSLQGVYLGTSNAVQQIRSLSFIAASGYARFFADEGVGPDHIDLRLPANAGAIVLYDATGGEIERVVYGSQIESVSQGRWPDGAANIIGFPGNSTPGALNYPAGPMGVVLNEVLARQHSVSVTGAAIDFIELHNPTSSSVNLGGARLSIDKLDPTQFFFATNTIVPPDGFLVIACDSSRPVSSNVTNLNIAQPLDGQSGAVYLFNPGGQLADSVAYGFQVEDKSIGRVGSQWRLLSAPTPNAANAIPAALGSNAALRVNEWMADPLQGTDWFELFNATNVPIDLNTVFITDDPSTAGRTQFRPAPLSFIGGGDFVKWIADGDQGEGRNHVSFALDAEGDSILVYDATTTTATPLEAIAFGGQTAGASQGRLPDGVAKIVTFLGAATPGESNALVLRDSDRDGIPDDVESERGLDPRNPADGAADADGDGATNAEEYLAGTNFRDAKSYLKLDRVSVGGMVVLSFNVLANRTYSVFYADSVVNPFWQKLTDVPARSRDETVSLPDTQAGNSIRFYRLVTPAVRP